MQEEEEAIGRIFVGSLSWQLALTRQSNTGQAGVVPLQRQAQPCLWPVSYCWNAL